MDVKYGMKQKSPVVYLLMIIIICLKNSVVVKIVTLLIFIIQKKNKFQVKNMADLEVSFRSAEVSDAEDIATFLLDHFCPYEPVLNSLRVHEGQTWIDK